MLTLQKVLAITVAIALVMWSLGLPGWLGQAEAAALTNVSDTLSDSGPSDVSDHTILFTTPTGMAADGSTFTITFDSNFATGSVAFGDIDVADDGSDLTLGASCPGVNLGVSITNSTITFENCATGGSAIAGGSVVEVEIGTNATGGTNQITNPSATTSYPVIIGGTWADSGETRVHIVDDVIVTASIDTAFTFAVTGIATGTSINSETVSTTGSTTGTAIPFGDVDAGGANAEFLGQLLTVTTNAPNGYTVTVSADQTLTSGGSATIDTFIDGAGTGSSTAWVSPAGTFGSDTTYGHWGITSDDDDVGSTTHSFGGGAATYYVGNFVNNPVPVMYHDSPVNGSGIGQGTTSVGYKIEITALQEAGADYTSTLTYVATPVF